MLTESIIRVGKPIVESDLPVKERIRWLTDVNSENCKNFFRNVFLIELRNEKYALHRLQIGDLVRVKRKENFNVDENRSISFPVLYPNGGNPLHAQGIYPLPCYLMYDAHIKQMDKPEEFAEGVLLPRLQKTLGYQNWSDEDKNDILKRVTTLLKKEADTIISEDKQLGILMIFDERLPAFKKLNRRKEESPYLWINESVFDKDQHLFLDGEQVLKGIINARFDEAGSLGKKKDAISTFTNQQTDEVVSVYNKSWLWLSPTWEMQKSIYWGDKDWTKGIKIDHESYEAYLYGAQFLKQIQVPVSNSILKEMFAPIENVEAKKHKKPSSFEAIFGIPIVLPLLDSNTGELYKKFRRMLKNDQELSNTDLHLEVLAGLKDSIVPESSDKYRLTILYYSGDLSRGAMHIRAIIEDVIPSVAYGIQKILKGLRRKGLTQIQKMFSLEENRVYRIETLPALLGNAYGSGYLWSSLQDTFHKKELRIERLLLSTSKKLNELANKEDYWAMKQELVFYHSFLYFLKNYNEKILGSEKGVKELAEWQQMIDAYHRGEIKPEEIESPEGLGFVAGMLLKQFSNSYYQKTKKDFVKHRVMKFGSKLNPKMIWKDGLMRCEELAAQWDLGLASNFRAVLGPVLLGFIDAYNKNLLVSEKDVFMTAFWSGYLIYKKSEEV
ncbi:MAG: hypothetical protein PHE70_07865 [Tepidanaerobacteraceae bacterium]|nr:hypothetical protein [Tepidanaerobacteraceae bacterium]